MFQEFLLNTYVAALATTLSHKQLVCQVHAPTPVARETQLAVADLVIQRVPQLQLYKGVGLGEILG